MLLARHSGQHDLTVGSPVAGRTHRQLEPLVGFFVNTLVLRLRPQGPLTVSEYLEAVREDVLGAQSHQELPFEALVDALAVQRDPSRSPLFQAMLVLHNTARRNHLDAAGARAVAADSSSRRPLRSSS